MFKKEDKEELELLGGWIMNLEKYIYQTEFIDDRYIDFFVTVLCQISESICTDLYYIENPPSDPPSTGNEEIFENRMN